MGTHHRTIAIDRVVDSFLKNGGKQVVSLGAGSDTRFWRLMVGLGSVPLIPTLPFLPFSLPTLWKLGVRGLDGFEQVDVLMGFGSSREPTRLI